MLCIIWCPFRAIKRCEWYEWCECNKKILIQESYVTQNFQANMFGILGKKTEIMRSKGFSLGRITYVHYVVGELYFLRLLLNHIKGSTSFTNLRKVGGIIYPIF